MDEEIMLDEEEKAYLSLIFESIDKSRKDLEQCKHQASQYSAQIQKMQQEVVKIELAAQNFQGALNSMQDLINKHTEKFIDKYGLPKENGIQVEIKKDRIIIRRKDEL